MDLNDMTNLIIASDAITKLQDALEVICGTRIIDGTIDKLMYLVEVIYNRSVCVDEEKDPDSKEFYRILYNEDLNPEERAKILLGMN